MKAKKVTKSYKRVINELRKVIKSYKRVIKSDLEASFSEILEKWPPYKGPKTTQDKIPLSR